MPGKVNPTQCEALTMVCCQVFGNHDRHHGGGQPGPFRAQRLQAGARLRLLQSVRLLADAARSFTDHCVAGIEANEARIRELMERSLMLVTALAPEDRLRQGRGDRQARASKRHHPARGGLRSGHVTAEEFDRLVRPEKMIRPG